jgi:hypothetical protein
MTPWWLTFTDGSQACCEGLTAYHAKRIAEKLTGKTVKGGQFDNIDAIKLPYPASPVIWQLDDPVGGKCPTFCSTPKQCAGRGSCPKSYACTE